MTIILSMNRTIPRTCLFNNEESIKNKKENNEQKLISDLDSIHSFSFLFLLFKSYEQRKRSINTMFYIDNKSFFL